MSPYEPVREERRKEQGVQEDQLSGGSTGYSCVQADQNIEIFLKPDFIVSKWDQRSCKFFCGI
jgi:hypothetical protein